MESFTLRAKLKNFIVRLLFIHLGIFMFYLSTDFLIYFNYIK